MSTGNLERRLMNLERASMKQSPATCQTCRRRHIRPMTIGVLRGILGVTSGAERPEGTPLCLCPCCIGEPGDRWFAQLSHGLDETDRR